MDKSINFQKLFAEAEAWSTMRGSLRGRRGQRWVVGWQDGGTQLLLRSISLLLRCGLVRYSLRHRLRGLSV